MPIQFSLKEKPIPFDVASERLVLLGAHEPNFRNRWIDFLDSQPMWENRHHPAVFEYYVMLSNPCHRDLSFIVMSGATPVAVAPLLIENVEGRVQASCVNGGFLPHPMFHSKLGQKALRTLEAFVFQECVSRLQSVEATRWYVESDILNSGTDVVEDQMASRFKALDISIHCHVIDLTDDLWSQMRHSAKSTINKGLRTYEFVVYDKSNFTFEVGERHRILHHKCSGRITRPIPSFHKMYSWVGEDIGLMFEQRYKGDVVQMIFVALGKGSAASSSAADDPDFSCPVPLTHSMNYFIYTEAQKRGIKYYRVGETSFRDHLFLMRSTKERTISDFKRGFGSQTLPWKRWIWFSSPAEELLYLKSQLAKYEQHLALQSEVGA